MIARGRLSWELPLIGGRCVWAPSTRHTSRVEFSANRLRRPWLRMVVPPVSTAIGSVTGGERLLGLAYAPSLIGGRTVREKHTLMGSEIGPYVISACRSTWGSCSSLLG